MLYLYAQIILESKKEKKINEFLILYNNFFLVLIFNLNLLMSI